MSTTEIIIPTPDLFSFDQCWQSLNRGYEESLYTLSEQKVSRCIRLDTGLAMLELTKDTKDQLRLTISKAGLCDQDIEACQSYVADWFDLDRDLKEFYQAFNSDDRTAKFAQQYYGLRLMGIVDLFEAMCWCVIGQQINLTFAHSIKNRLVHHCGKYLEVKGVKHYCFPEPQAVLSINEKTLKDMQFSRQKIQYLYNVSEAFVSEQLNKASLMAETGEQQLSQLSAIKGIGPWTANYVSMKSLRNMRCIAYGDTGLSSALYRHFDTNKKPDYATIDGIFAPFAPWESYLNFYLWHSLMVEAQT